MNTKSILQKIVTKYSPLLITAVILSFILSKLVVVGTDLIQTAINTLTLGENIIINQLFLEMTTIIILSMIASFFKSTFCGNFSLHVQKECKEKIIENIKKADCNYFTSQGELTNKLTTDIGDMGNLLSELLPEIIQYIVTIIVVGIAILKMNLIIFIAVATVIPLSLFISNKIATKIGNLAAKRKGKYDELTDIILDNIGGIEVAKAYNIENILYKRVNNKTTEILKNEYARNRYQAISNALTLFIKWIPTIICLLIALIMILEKVITTGEFMGFVILFNKIFEPIGELPFRITEAREMLVSVSRIETLMNLTPEKTGDYKENLLTTIIDKENVTNKENIRINRSNVIELENISFNYNTQLNNLILSNISLSIKQGEKIALVGESGSGKSTLLKRLCGFVRVNSGTYKLYGHSFEEWNMDEARKKIAIVWQDTFLFTDTIINNIAYGDSVINIEKVKKVCKLAGIYDFIMSLENNFDTVLTERGITISGGERQRIAIARALYKDASIILMDEPTSALDEDTQKIINKLIYNDKTKTVITVAHRLSTIQNADKIYYLANGKILESGSHEELMAKKGHYKALYDKENY